jgi:hypothetical protein
MRQTDLRRRLSWFFVTLSPFYRAIGHRRPDEAVGRERPLAMIAVGEGWRIGMNGECKFFVNRARTSWQMSILNMEGSLLIQFRLILTLQSRTSFGIYMHYIWSVP